MTETLKEAIERGAQVVYESWADVPGYVPWVVGGNSCRQSEARHIADKIVAPLIAKRDALKARGAELELALSRVKLIALTAGAPGELSVKGAFSRIVRIALDAGIDAQLCELRKIAETPACFNSLQARGRGAGYSIVALHRQVERLRDGLLRTTAALAAAISAYDKFRNKGITGDALYSTRINDFNKVLDDARATLSALDAPQPDVRDAIIAEAVEVLRPFSDAWKSALGVFDRPHTQAIIEAVAKYYIEASHLKAARAFVEKRGGSK